jgi:hypothetical protein
MSDQQPDDDHAPPSRQLVEIKKSIIGHLADYSSFVISICALALSIYSAWESREHDKISVQPRLEFSMVANQNMPEVGIYIENTGLGPAFVADMRIYLDGRRTGGWNDLANTAQAEANSPFKQTGLASTRDVATKTIKSGETDDLLTTPGSNATDDFSHLLTDRLFVVVDYSSVYGDLLVHCKIGRTGNDNSKDCASYEAQLSKK